MRNRKLTALVLAAALVWGGAGAFTADAAGPHGGAPSGGPRAERQAPAPAPRPAPAPAARHDPPPRHESRHHSSRTGEIVAGAAVLGLLIAATR